MKASMFNVLTSHNGKTYISNTLTKSISTIDAMHQQALETNRFDTVAESLPALKENGFVVDKDFDELGALRYAYQMSKSSTEELEFVVAPTMNCNFRCTYCFENPRPGKMSEEVQNAVTELIRQKVLQLKPKRVRYIWFGGEPLLCLDIVENMSRILSSFMKEQKVFLDMIVITNGYLISEDVISRLEKVGVTHFQITIDGSRELHDGRRILHNGEGTYDRICGNLSCFSSHTATVGIRVNIDKNNLGAFRLVQDEIRKLGNSNIKCYPALVEPASNHDEDKKSSCFCNNCQAYYNSPDIAAFYSYMQLDNLGLQLCYCGAEHNHSFAVDEKGNLYKCWNTIGDPEKILSTVFDSSNQNSKIAAAYLGRDPFSEEECCKCPYLPICGGGCVNQRFLNGSPSCCERKYLYDSIIRKSVDKLLSA